VRAVIPAICAGLLLVGCFEDPRFGSKIKVVRSSERHIVVVGENGACVLVWFDPANGPQGRHLPKEECEPRP
jgi:hypothetical protein